MQILFYIKQLNLLSPTRYVVTYHTLLSHLDSLVKIIATYSISLSSVDFVIRIAQKSSICSTLDWDKADVEQIA